MMTRERKKILLKNVLALAKAVQELDSLKDNLKRFGLVRGTTQSRNPKLKQINHISEELVALQIDICCEYIEDFELVEELENEPKILRLLLNKKDE